MKNKCSHYLNQFHYVMNTQLFKIVFIFMLALASYSFILGFEDTYLDANLFVFSWGWTNLIILLNLFLIVSTTYYTFDKNTEYIIRLKNKKTYLKELIKQVLFNCTIILVLQFILIQIALFVICFMNGFGNRPYLDYHISKLVYFIFYMIRFYLLYLGISLINVFLFKIVQKEFVIGLNAIIGAMMISSSSHVAPKTGIEQMSFFFYEYLRPLNYQNFRLEFLCSFIYIIFFIFCMILLYKIVYRFFRKIGD